MSDYFDRLADERRAAAIRNGTLTPTQIPEAFSNDIARKRRFSDLMLRYAAEAWEMGRSGGVRNLRPNSAKGLWAIYREMDAEILSLRRKASDG